MLTVQKIAFLSRIELFSSMTTQELGRIARISKEVVYSAGTVIFKEGDYGDYMLLVIEGEVRIHHGDKELIVCKTDDYFGEMTLLDGDARSASATAVTDCLLLRIDQADFQEILSGAFEVVQSVMRTLSRRIRKKEAELRALSSGT